MADEDIDESVCAKGRCKQESAVIYLGTPLCDKHWVQLCNKQEKALEALRDEALLGRKEEVSLSLAQGSRK